MSLVVYRSTRTDAGVIATKHINDRPTQPLDPRLDLRSYSPTGFEMGYSGSGPAQLALAILADYLGENDALEKYQEFKRQFVARYRDSSRITAEAVDRWAKTVSGAE